MKKVLFAILSFCISLMTSAQVFKNINLTSAGTLSMVLTKLDKASTTNLTLTGLIDARDFLIIRDSIPNLSIVDLSDVTIVEYIGTEGTGGSSLIDYPADVLPEIAFNSNLGNYTFKSILLPQTIKSIGAYAFNNCKAITSFSIPSSVTYIDHAAFQNCIGLTTITIPNSVTFINESAFAGCTNLTSVYIPSSVTSIVMTAFAFCSHLKFVTIPSSITQIDNNMFLEDSSLYTVILPPTITSIGNQAFYSCTSLQTITIPASVNSIGTYAFINCTGLTSVYSLSSTPVNLTSSTAVFGNVKYSNCTLYVPMGSMTAYQSANQWSAFTKIVELNMPVSTNSISITACESYTFNGTNYTSSGAYNQILKNIAGGDSIITLNLTINNLPTVTLGSDISICYSPTYTFSDDQATNYSDLQWISSGDGSFNLTNTLHPTYTFGANDLINKKTTISLDVQGLAGCDYVFSTINITVNPIPTLNALPQVQNICNGKNAYINATAGMVSYLWSDGSNNSELMVTPMVNKTYVVTAVDSNGCIATSSALINITPSPTVTISQTQTSVCQGNFVNLTAATAKIYKWSTNDTVATISKVPTATTTYSVTGTNPMGCSSIAQAVVTVNQKPTITITASPSTSICPGTQVTLIPTGGGTMYKWNDGQQSLSPVKYSPITTSTYTLTSTSAQGCTGTAAITISISSPIITVTATPDSITSGSSTFISASGGNTYSWDNGATYIATNSKTFTPTASTIYTVKGKDVNSCIGYGSAKVIVDGKPISQISSIIVHDTTVVIGTPCKLKPIILPIDASNKTLTWSTNNGGLATITTGGIVSGLQTGDCGIQYSATDGSGISGSLILHIVTSILPTSLTISPTGTLSLLTSNTLQLTSIVNPSNASNQTVNWISSNTAIATVSSGGVVTPTSTSGGTVIITATSSVNATIKATSTINVISEGIAVSAVSLNMSNMNINVNQQNVPLTAIIIPSNASNTALTWKSSDSSIAFVNSQGLVTGMKVGSCTIKAISQSNPAILASCTVTVSQSITTTKTVLTMKIQDAQTLYTMSTEGIATGQYPVGSKAILQSAINSAILINQNTTSTQAQIDQAVIDLTSAVTTFQVKSIIVNKVALQSTIQEAQILYNNAIEGTLAGQYPLGSKANLKSAIDVAIAITQNAIATQAQVDQAVGTLNTEITAFKAKQVVTVKIPVSGMKILDGSQNLQVGQSFIFHAQTIPMNATSQQIIWYYINANNSSDKGSLGNGTALPVTPPNAGNFWIYAFSNEYKISGKDTTWYHDSVNVEVIQHIAVSQVFANISGSMKVLIGATDKSASAYVYPSTATNKAVTWTSSNSAIATVDQNGVIEGIAKGSVNIVVASIEDPTKFATFIVEVVEPVIDKSQLKGAIEYSDYIISYITPNQLGTNAGQYSPTLMAALKDQNTVSKAVLNASSSSQIEVSLSTAALNKAIYDFKNSLVGAIDITSVTLNTSTINVALTATPYMLSATILPSNATYKTLLWKSSDASIATVDQNGLVTFVGAGVTEITATTTDGTAITVNCYVVVSVPAESIYIPQTIGLKVGEIVPLKAFILPLNASNKLVNWTSSDSTIATVDVNGMVTAISVGSAKIIAQSVDGQKTAVSIASVSAIDITMSKITLPTSPLQMIVGESKNIEAIITPFNATNKTIFWKSTNMASLAVDYTGVVTAIGIDTVRVYAFNQDKTIIDSIEVFISASKAPVIIPVEPVVVKTGTTNITIALTDLVVDDKTSLNNLTFVTSTDANFIVTVVGDSLIITPKNAQTALTGTINVVVVDQDNQSSTIDIPVTVSSAANTAPILTSVPKQSMIVGGTFIPVTLSQNVKDDYTKPTDIVWTVATNSNLQASISYGVLTVNPKVSSWTGIDSIIVTASDNEGLTKTMYIQFSVSNKINEAPVLVQIPVQEQTSTVSFQPINLTKYVSDDYTASSYIVWTVSKSNKLTVSIVNGKAYLTVIDKNWVGSEMITFTATDQSGLSSQVSVVCNQKAVAVQNTWTGKPEVNFMAERTNVGVNDQVYFHGSVTGQASDGYEWTLVGGTPASSNDLNPTIKYSKVGKYDVLFVAGNNGLLDSSEVKTYINVIGITSPDTTICKGSAITLSVSDKALTKYTWSNGATTATITVTPTANIKYSVIAQSGLFKYYDTVLVSISKPVSLGNDTAICAGSSVLYSLNGYSTFKWNNNSSLTSNSFTATSAQTVTVETKDAYNCVTSASAQISVNALPTVDLGANDSICPSSLKVLDAGAGLTSYKWSTGITAQTITVSSSAIYTVTVSNASGCKNTDAVKVVVKQPFNEELGVATILGPTNIVLAWNRSSAKNTKSYTVLRETTSAGKFEPVGTTLFGDTSYVVDKDVTPLQQIYRYKLSTTDNCGTTVESPIVHQTMLLQAVYSESTNANQLSWNGYLGVSLSTYNIYRNGKRIKSLAASSGNNSYAFNDVDGIKGDLYQIKYDLPDTIFTTKLKSDSGPFSQSLSNLAESELTESALTAQNSVSVYPNPAEDNISVSFGTSVNAKVEIVNVQGQVVLTKAMVNESIANLSVEILDKGVYFIKTTSDESVTLTQLIKL